MSRILSSFNSTALVGKWVERPTPTPVVLDVRDNRNSITWANEDMIADGNRHFEHKYFTIRERIDLGEISVHVHWLSGKINPADVTNRYHGPRGVAI